MMTKTDLSTCLFQNIHAMEMIYQTLLRQNGLEHSMQTRDSITTCRVGIMSEPSRAVRLAVSKAPYPL